MSKGMLYFKLTSVIFISIILLIILGFYTIYLLYILSNDLFFNQKLPDFDLEEIWGPESDDTSVRPFRIRFDDEMIKDLKYRLKNYRKFPSLNGTMFQYGFNSDAIANWITYWAEEYPFKEREEALNQYPQYKTNIQGLDIHFIWVKPKVDSNIKVVPMLLLHGWPSSVREFYETIPHLTAASEAKDFAVEAVVPSLPGYGYSDATTRPGLAADKMAVIFRNLMHRLGHQQFYVQGGDWGSLIGRHMATFFPQEVLGYHSNFPIFVSPFVVTVQIVASFFPKLLAEPGIVDRMYDVNASWLLKELGYTQVFTYIPDTIGVGLSDSPTGLLAAVLQKFSMASNKSYRDLPDGGLNIFSREQILDNVMIYWTSNSITTSMRMYAESFASRHLDLGIDRIPSPVPTCVIQALNDVAVQPPFIIRMKHPNLLRTTILEGGHHLALERPKPFADDVLDSIVEFRKWHAEKKDEL